MYMVMWMDVRAAWMALMTALGLPGSTRMVMPGAGPPVELDDEVPQLVGGATQRLVAVSHQ
jgi:hypothetical protein